MRIRGSMVVGFACVGATAALAAPNALSQVTGTVQTHPSVAPRIGHRRSTFELTFTLAQAPGRAGLMDTYYREVVSPPAHAPQSCSTTQPPAVLSGAQDATVKLPLRAPARGWCKGRYDVTVFLQHTSSCGPPLDGAALIICPESTGPVPVFPVADLDTGQAHFTVR